MRPDVLILVFWMLSFKPSLSLSSFTFIKSLFSSSLLSVARVVSSAYLRLLIFLPQSWFQLVLHPVWHFTWCTLHISYIIRVTVYSLDVLFSQWEDDPSKWYFWFVVCLWGTQVAWWLREWRICWKCRRPRYKPWIEKIPCRGEWLSTPVFLPREFHGWGSLAGYGPWGCKEANMAELLMHSFTYFLYEVLICWAFSSFQFVTFFSPIT